MPISFLFSYIDAFKKGIEKRSLYFGIEILFFKKIGLSSQKNKRKRERRKGIEENFLFLIGILFFSSAFL